MTPGERLAALEPACTREEALAFYDSLPGVPSADVLGRWRGRELATGHPMDGALEASGWYGKAFDSVDQVHPLLFSTPSGELFAAEPRKMPLGLAGRVPASAVSKGRSLLGVVKPAIRTKKHRARLRDVAHRGVVSVAMVYDHLPIIDHFRLVDEDTLLGCMDLRGRPPYFFVLARDDA